MVKGSRKKDEIEENEEDWVQIYPNNPHVKYNEKTKVWKCVTCGVTHHSSGGSGNHMKGTHGIDIYGNKITVKEPTPPSSSKSNESEPTEEQQEMDLKIKPDDDANTRAIKMALKMKLNPPGETDEAIPALVSLTDMVHAESSKEIASQSVQLVTDVDLMFLYHKTKKLFPPDFTFKSWVVACVNFTLRNFLGVKVSVTFNPEGLDADKLKYILQVSKDWAEIEKKQISESEENGK